MTALIWQPVVTLNSVDISDKVTGQITIEAEEATARIAAFKIAPDSGTVSAGDWLNQAVTIDFKTLNSAGSTLTQNRVFTGVVDDAFYNPTTRLVNFDCTDNMQGQFEAMTQTAIDAVMTDARWSEAVFGEYEDGWLYLEDLLKTHPQSYDFNRDGTTGTLVDWAAKVTPDYSYDSGDIFDGSINYSIAPRRQLFNQFTINYNYRFDRLKHRSHDFSWANLAFCPYFAQSHDLPTRDMITTAADSAGWSVVHPILFGAVPKSKAAVCGTIANWVISDEKQETLVMTAEFSAVKRWSQQVTENYTLTVSAPQSVTWLGAIGFEERASNETETDSEGWLDGIATPTGRTDALGDIVQDKYNRTISDNDIETLIARARTEILSAHRGNYVWADIELNPLLERFHTVRLNSGGIDGTGKVFKLKHVMDLDAGSATTEVKVAISLNGGEAAITDDTIEAPTAPGTDPDITAPDSSTALPSRIGNDDTAANFDDDWEGFTGNYTVAVGSPTENQIYPIRFKVVTPDIDQEAIDHIEADKTQTYEFDIPNETLTITVS